ncbi:dual specificity protein phosphatase 22 isoform X1 [Tribolium castaneum]|uniref:dual specificity protein phosphatase 22 isoform X1 n=1 Tax=Tribolium castaneum TaxID=7070 RepID=UPI00077DC204|nr:PREDICTED: dual specificity protein phosphatase 22 isoform X1 [Tribolium castaneum]|eukprot:XP_015833311.1 PREDICTED: dual specificity protein phosphatase 22 isoform X1 [Tribolium castaneum]
MFSFLCDGDSLKSVDKSQIPSFGCSKVLPGLYVGNYRDSKDANQLAKHNITHILAIHDSAKRIHSDKHYLCVMASDSPDQNLTQYFSICNDFIHAARLREGNVLIHCLAGMSRSVTVAVAYIMSVTNLNWKEALKVVRAGRAVANPNLGFQKQLQDFEATRLAKERRRLKERYPSLALVNIDREQCSLMLNNYEELLQSRSICEGRCALGEECPTGICRSKNQNPAAHQPRSRRQSRSTRSRSEMCRSPSGTSAASTSTRPRSGPAGLRSYTGSAPPSRTSSRVDISSIGVSGNLTAPTTPQTSPPISPKRRGTVAVPLALKEDDFDL